jgi:hypothetical protein
MMKPKTRPTFEASMGQGTFIKKIVPMIFVIGLLTNSLSNTYNGHYTQFTTFFIHPYSTQIQSAVLANTTRSPTTSAQHTAVRNQIALTKNTTNFIDAKSPTNLIDFPDSDKPPCIINVRNSMTG